MPLVFVISKLSIFIYSIKEIYKNNKKNLKKNPKKLLIEAANRTKVKGSSTCCLIVLDKEEKKINSAYIGDSVYMITRFNKDLNKFIKFYKCQDQSHSFNQPYQIGTFGDSPEEGNENSHEVENKDVIVLATDG